MTIYNATVRLALGSAVKASIIDVGVNREYISAHFSLDSDVWTITRARYRALIALPLQGGLSFEPGSKFFEHSTFHIGSSVLAAYAYVQNLNPPTFEGVTSTFEEILTALLDNLARTVSSKTRGDSAAVRQQIGIVRSDYAMFLQTGKFGDELLSCFTLAREAGVDLSSLAYVRDQLFATIPDSEIATALVQMAIVFCLSAESHIIAAMEFNSRDDVEAIMTRMRTAFDTARELAADDMDSGTYQTLTYLHGALTNHLATTARPLPRMINFSLNQMLPTLALSQRLYYVSTRAEELASENKIVHPAFSPMALRGLSA